MTNDDILWRPHLSADLFAIIGWCLPIVLIGVPLLYIIGCNRLWRGQSKTKLSRPTVPSNLGHEVDMFDMIPTEDGLITREQARTQSNKYEALAASIRNLKDD